MKWPAGISILSWALSGTCIVIAGFGVGFSGDAKDSPSSIIMVDAGGQAARLDAVLPGSEIGLIVVSDGQKEPEIADNATDGSQPQPEPAKPARKSGASSSKAGSSKSGAAKKTAGSSKSSGPKSPASPKPASASACVNINTADETALTALKGIGPAMAARIIEHRAASGPFRKKEDIQNVKGIGPAKFAAIADAICL